MSEYLLEREERVVSTREEFIAELASAPYQSEYPWLKNYHADVKNGVRRPSVELAAGDAVGITPTGDVPMRYFDAVVHNEKGHRDLFSKITVKRSHELSGKALSFDFELNASRTNTSTGVRGGGFDATQEQIDWAMQWVEIDYPIDHKTTFSASNVSDVIDPVLSSEQAKIWRTIQKHCLLGEGTANYTTDSGNENKLVNGWINLIKTHGGGKLHTTEGQEGSGKVFVGEDFEIVLAKKAIEVADDHLLIPAYDHNLPAGARISITGTTNYDRTHTVLADSPTDKIKVKKEDTDSQTETIGADAKAWWKADAKNPHQLVLELSKLIHSDYHPNLEVFIGRDLLHWQKTVVAKNWGLQPSEQIDVSRSDKIVGGYNSSAPSFLPKGTIILVNPSTMHLYLSKKWTRIIKDQSEKNQTLIMNSLYFTPLLSTFKQVAMCSNIVSMPV